MSLRLRLGLWYGALTTLLIALVCTYSYAIHSRAHYDELDHVLQHAAEHVAAELSIGSRERSTILDASLLLGIGIRVLDPDGTVRAQSRAARTAPPLDLHHVLTTAPVHPYAAIAMIAPPLQVSEPSPGRFSLLMAVSGDRFRVYVLPLHTLRAGRAPPEYLAAIVPLRHIDDAVLGFAWLMLVMTLAGGVAAFVAGWVLARHVLRPVASLTDTAAAIARSRALSRRVADGSQRDELGRLAHTFNSMLASLEEASDAQIRFVSAASHELRAPLTVVQANLDLLQSGRVSESERATAVAEAYTEANRMARLVADLLVLARADAGVPILRQRVELDRVVLQVVGEARHLARGQRLEVTHVEPVLVQGDPDRLKQLFLNLIENAIKYTPTDGVIRISIEHADGEDGMVVVLVRDTGIGMTAAELSRAFDRFFRADPARSRNPGGSGLGLAIADWVAREHGGTIALTSTPGQGTTATVRLPAGG